VLLLEGVYGARRALLDSAGAARTGESRVVVVDKGVTRDSHLAADRRRSVALKYMLRSVGRFFFMRTRGLTMLARFGLENDECFGLVNARGECVGLKNDACFGLENDSFADENEWRGLLGRGLADPALDACDDE
jgi:hypothetical protein